MSKPQDKIMPYIAIAISLATFLWGGNIVGTPMKEVRADLDVLRKEVVTDRVESGKNISSINTSITNIEKTLERLDKKIK